MKYFDQLFMGYFGTFSPPQAAGIIITGDDVESGSKPGGGRAVGRFTRMRYGREGGRMRGEQEGKGERSGDGAEENQDSGSMKRLTPRAATAGGRNEGR